MNDKQMEKLLNELREERNNEIDSVYFPDRLSSLRPRFHYSGIPEKDFESFGIR